LLSKKQTKPKSKKLSQNFPPLNPKEFDDHHHDNKDEYDYDGCIMGFVKFVKNTLISPTPSKVHLHNWFLEALLQPLFPS
jgi:hypothetical protein